MTNKSDINKGDMCVVLLKFIHDITDLYLENEPTEFYLKFGKRGEKLNKELNDLMLPMFIDTEA